MGGARYFSDVTTLGVTCFLCGGAHVRSGCPNRLCFSCGSIGHVKCKQTTTPCWNCLGRHKEGAECPAEMFMADAADGVKVAGASLCGDCDSTSCTVLSCRHVSFKGTQDWYGEGGLKHCTLCGVDGHTAYDCRKMKFIPRLISAIRNGGKDPRHPLPAAPEHLIPGPPLPECSTKVAAAARNAPAAAEAGDAVAAEITKQGEKRQAGGRSAAAQARRDQKKAKQKEKASKRKHSGAGEPPAKRAKKA